MVVHFATATGGLHHHFTGTLSLRRLQAEYLTTLLDWLERESENYSIEKWFFFTTWKDITTATFDGYMGIIFFEGQDAGSELNCLGKIFRSYSMTGTSGGITCPTTPHVHQPR